MLLEVRRFALAMRPEDGRYEVPAADALGRAPDRPTVAWRLPMLSADMMRYVELHRTAGFKFRTQYEMLARFVTFAEQHGDEFVRVDRTLEWAARAPSAAQRCKLLLEVRRFALAMR